MSRLSPAERRRAGGLAAAVVALHVLGFGLLMAAGAHGAIGLGVGITAYTLGLRHAFDADHIGAIDNTTRKLMAEGQRPLGVGFFFSLGHSTIVFALGVIVWLGVRGVGGAVENGRSGLHQATGLVGPLISGSFLLLIGLVNLVILAGIVRVLRQVRAGALDDRRLEQALTAGGPMNRLFARVTRLVRRPWQMYPVGLLFGLGFDTATEVALLVLAGGAAASGMPFYAILCLPVLFAAGMSLLDTIDGAFMTFAYGWAFARPVRRLFYNVTVTGLSVAVALGVGGIELAGVLAGRLGLTGGVWGWASGIDLNVVGYAVVALFVGTWAIALAVWHFGRVEERWLAGATRATGE
jgi:high-affinity nickel-transport protein